MHRYRPWLLGFVVAAAACFGVRAAEPTPAVAAPELLTQLGAPDAPLVLDVRSPEEYAAGHVPGAINVPHRDVEAWLARTPPDPAREIVVYCRSGVRAALALDTLSRLGRTHARHLTGDYSGWVAAGHPVEMSTTPPP
jgi:phage shock protein E